MSEVIHYSKYGYNGNFTCTSSCGKEIHTHNDKENKSSINIDIVDCQECKDSETYKQDIENFYKNLYLEVDFLTASEYRTSLRTIRYASKDIRIDRVIENADHDKLKTWEEIKKYENIYFSSSFYPLVVGSIGAPYLLQALCKKALEENITGKNIYCINSGENLDLEWIDDKNSVIEAFKNNKFYVLDDEYENFVEFNFSKAF